MKIKRLYINNYKSLVDFELIEPNPFSVFVGPNAAGKSNIFEALEFLSLVNDAGRADELFGGAPNYLNMKEFKKIKYENQPTNYNLSADIEFQPFTVGIGINFHKRNGNYYPVSIGVGGGFFEGSIDDYFNKTENDKKWYREIFSRIFIGKNELVTSPIKSSNKLSLDCSNIENVLYRLLQDEIKREEITDWLKMLIPELDKVEVAKSDHSGDYFLRIFEKNLDEPIGKNLISDGTYNILALLTAVYQSDEPQFLCIEEPENGLNPFVIQEMVNLFRQLCEEKGHYIWLNTHSPTLVRELQPKEVILIDKKKGITKAKQIQHDLKLYSLKLDEAWLSNALGGGLPW